MVDARGELVRMAVDPRLDPELLGSRRLAALAKSSIDEVVTKVGGADVVRAGDVLVAVPETRPGFGEADARDVVDELGADATLKGARVAVAGRGHAGALAALSAGVARLAAGRAEVCTVVGVDSYAHADTIEWLDANRQLVGEGVRGGFAPGEAAGAVVLATAGVRRTLRLPSLGIVRGAHAAVETKLIKTDADVLGEGLFAAISGALSELTIPSEAIDATYCDINGERYRADEWTFAALRLGDALRTTQFDAPSDCWGDVGAASGVLGCILAVWSWARKYAKGPRALVWGSSEAGLRGAAVLEHVPGSVSQGGKVE
jgi:3-oxoacyl-[acyl-carrier-protein] synthase-1